MTDTAALPLLLRPSFPRFPTAPPPSLERRRPVVLLQSSAFIRRESLSCSARNCKATRDRGGRFIPSAYVTGPASDAVFSESESKFSASGTPEKEEEVIGWGLLWSLLWRHRLRLGVAFVTLIGCTTCTLSMPLFSGKFFEVLVGANSEPLLRLLGKIGILYLLEPVFTVLFVVNINIVWEKVMSSMRALIFRRVLVQKVEFFDRYKIGELTGLLTSDLGSLKDVVSENVSRDRGFRALSEVVGTVCILFSLAPQLAPVLGVLMLAVSVLVAIYKRSTIPIFKAHGSAQASIADCVTETLSAIRTVRSFGGEKRQMLVFGNQVLAYQNSGIKLGAFKSANESLTRVAVYISLLALYCLGGNKVRAKTVHGINMGRISYRNLIDLHRVVFGEKFILVLIDVSKEREPFCNNEVARLATWVPGIETTTCYFARARLRTYADILLNPENAFCTVNVLQRLCRMEIGELSIGTMVSFVGYTFTLTFAVQGLVNTFGDLRGTFSAVERINSVLSGVEIDGPLDSGLSREIRKTKKDNEKHKLFAVYGLEERMQSSNAHYMSVWKSITTTSVCGAAWSGDVCLEDVYFSYPLRPDVEILRGLSLSLKCGTVTALVGPSGAGKSTIVQLLARFYEPTKGRITVGGEDVRTFDKREWARAVSIVNQEPVLFSVSVGENIAYGLPDDDVSKEDIIKAAKAANAHDFIISLPQGYDTLVGERGGLLSGGQRQRVAIARALLKNAPILILDEATSALDTVSERLVQEALYRLMKGRTTMVIAHRLSTVQNAHQIALCSQGRIAELGTHSQLLSKKGQYASLVGTQRLAFE